jgi:hypothetical protein
MKATYLLLCMFFISELKAQELYPSTEPASTMSAKSIGIRLNNDLFPSHTYQADNFFVQSNTSYRLNPELMWGINKKWMFHLSLYASDCRQSNFKFEGSGIYLKYRFLAHDEVQSHFRMAVYGKASVINNPIQYDEINLGGDNSGVGAGIIATQLLHKVALSFTGGYLRAMNNIDYPLSPTYTRDEINYCLSAGWLFLPFEYKSYSQPNLNVFVEFLGKSNPSKNESYLDIAPALQLILNSIVRLDLIYEKQLYGNMTRIDTQIISFRFEYNFLNAYK